MTLAACDDYEDQFNLDSQITDVKKGTAIVLTDADYANIAGLAANKTLAAKLDAESGTNAYTEALAKLHRSISILSSLPTSSFLLLSPLIIRRPMLALSSRLHIICIPASRNSFLHSPV